MLNINIIIEYIISSFIVLYSFSIGRLAFNTIAGLEEDLSRNIYFFLLLLFSIIYILLNIINICKILYNNLEILLLLLFSFYNIVLTVFHAVLNNNIDIVFSDVARQISFPIMLLCFLSISYYSNNFKRCIKIIIIGVLLSFFYNNIIIKNYIENDVFRSPASMFFVILFPLCFLISKNIIYELLFISFLFSVSVLSLNRGITLSVVIFSLIYSFLRFKKIKVRISIFFIIFIIFYLFIISDSGVVLIRRFSDIPYDEGSGRFYIWKAYLNLIANGNILNYLFGFGFRIPNSSIGVASHNDFINFMLYFGLFSFIMYLFLHLNIIKSIFTFNTDRKVFIYTLSFYIIFLINSIVINFFQVYSQFLGICFGVYLGLKYKNIYEIKSKKYLYK